MESKHVFAVSITLLTSSFNRTSMESKHVDWLGEDGFSGAFNRTSMESKPELRVFKCVGCKTFNRTSMESKPCRIVILYRRMSFLLIEPVWNRNESSNHPPNCRHKKPFNRTSMESKQYSEGIEKRVLGAFNRTSMESKLRIMARARVACRF